MDQTKAREVAEGIVIEINQLLVELVRIEIEEGNKC